MLALTETMQSRDSQERRHGFDTVMARFAPRLKVQPSLESHGDPERTRRILNAALASARPVAGIYLMSHDVQTALETIEQAGLARHTTIIGHELTPNTRERLSDGRMDAVIAQDVRHMVRSSIRILRARADGLETIASQERIRIEIILRENMPEQSE